MSNLTSTQEKVASLLGLTFKNRTGKGWYMGCTCPKCGKSDKFGVKFNFDRDGEYKNHVTIHCFHGSCGLSGSEKVLFKLLGREDLISTYEYREDFGTLSKLQLKEKEIVPDYKKLPKKHPPIGYKRVYENEYLQSRGLDSQSFKRYPIGVSRVESRLKDYVIFLVYENGENKGYLSRITYSKKKYDYVNSKRKEKGLNPLPKYKNESGVEFSELIYGFDEITDNTHTAILVEGVLDKINTDIQLKLYRDNSIFCGCTFGKKISTIQMLKLRDRGIQNIILMYDPDATESIKQYSYELMLNFDKVLIANLIGEKDPGDMNYSEFVSVLSNLETPLSFRINTLSKKI